MRQSYLRRLAVVKSVLLAIAATTRTSRTTMRPKREGYLLIDHCGAPELNQIMTIGAN